MSINRSLIILDTETSGLDPYDGAEVVEIYAKAINYWDLAPHHVGDFHAYIKPRRPEKAQAGALKVIGPLWAKAMDTGLDAKVVWSNYLEWVHSVNDNKNTMSKPITCAFNMPFDSKFIRYHTIEELGLIKKGNFGYETPWSFEFDALAMAYMLFESDPGLNDLKLNTMLSRLNLKRANADVHTAKEDVELLTQFVVRSIKFCRECYKRLRVTTDVKE